MLPLHVLSDIVGAVRAARGTEKDFSEFTVEVNPDDIVSGGLRYAESLSALGVDRISMGVQSFDDRILKWMNRRHDAAEAVEAYRILRQAGIENISVDLIFGLPMMDDRQWNGMLDRTLDLPGGRPEHISAYQLSIEDGSALASLAAAGRYEEASDEVCSRQYDILCSRLAEAGYHHYEVSNFALPGREAVHNSAYWTGCPYLGLGPGAHSYRTDGGKHIRSRNLPSVEKYIAALSSSGQTGSGLEKVREYETLTADQVALEKIMLAMRTDRGLPEEELRAAGDSSGIARMMNAGYLIRLPDGRVRIPESRFFISDSIIAAIS